MHGYVSRSAESALQKALNQAPAVAILGARQCGKSTLARTYLAAQRVPNVFLDMQDRSDRNKLNEPELFFERHRETLVCLDEIQLAPDLFPVLRVEIDKHRRHGRFLILGSASCELLQQSTETLAGRIAFLELTPFLLSEVGNIVSWQDVWQRGGFPESLLAASEDASYDWRENFIRTFLERDIPQLGFAIPYKIMERLWRLLAHYHGQTLNYSKTAAAADISVPTFRKYLSILEQTYMLRLLPPSETNLKKRLIQSPKLYMRDSGLFHALRNIESFDDLMAHPANGASWEGFVIENLIAANPRWHASYVRTSNAAEVDLILERGRRRMLIECKLSKAPVPSRGFHQLIADMKPDAAWLAAPVDVPYDYQTNIRVGNIRDIRLNY
ncbi:MAG: ATP-binding protein [Candidatus Riflebacteria bacterium]|nr:ATP-binding protein [Candidatus Riflebacteria bacterium]